MDIGTDIRLKTDHTVLADNYGSSVVVHYAHVVV